MHSGWSKEIELSKQNSTHHPLIVNNPIDKKSSEFMRRKMQWGKMAVSEDYASCWVYKDLTVTTKKIRALLTAARAPGEKDEGQVRPTCIRDTGWAQR